MKKILVVIDMQNDFITGALPADGGVEIVSRIVEKIKSEKYFQILCTQDYHIDINYSSSLEGSLIPAHCIYGTKGFDIIDEISNLNVITDIIYKTTFGSNRDLDSMIQFYSPFNEDFEIELCGVCTDICVISNALILRAAFPNTRIIVDSSCCAGTTKEAHEAALKVMKNCLIEVI